MVASSARREGRCSWVRHHHRHHHHHLHPLHHFRLIANARGSQTPFVVERVRRRIRWTTATSRRWCASVDGPPNGPATTDVAPRPRRPHHRHAWWRIDSCTSTSRNGLLSFPSCIVRPSSPPTTVVVLVLTPSMINMCSPSCTSSSASPLDRER